jgi:DNA adenine methylase
MKPIISYYGGKQRMASKIVPLIPHHLMYVEPFFGGGAVFFAKGKPKASNQDYRHEIINDKDERLINFYRCFQNNFGELYQRIIWTLDSEAEHRRAKEMMTSPDSFSEVDLAWAYYVNIQQSFANVLDTGWARAKGTPARNLGATWWNKTARLEALHERFKDVAISCTDALKVIQQRDHENSFFYLDPPYPGTDLGYYDGYTIEDFQELIDLLATVKGKFILSNYNQEKCTFPNNWIKHEFNAVCSASKDRTSRTEVVWMNYNPNQQQDLLVNDNLL